MSLRITAWFGSIYDRQASKHVAMHHVHHDVSASAGRYNTRLLHGPMRATAM